MLKPQTLAMDPDMARKHLARNPNLVNANFGRAQNWWNGNQFNIPALTGNAGDGKALYGLFGGGQAPQMRGMSGVLAQLMMGGGKPF